MRVVRGRAATPTADERLTRELVSHTDTTGEQVVRIRRPHPAVTFGRRDRNRAGYDEARRLAAEAGYTPRERRVGGHAVAFTGNTVAFTQIVPVADSRTEIQDRYERMTRAVTTAFESLDVSLETGEPAAAFCPGTHSLSANGKVVGLAQRVHSTVALVSGIVLVCDHDEIAAILGEVYRALDIPFDPDTTGSIARAGGPADPTLVCETLQETLMDDEATVEHVGQSKDRRY